MNNLRLLAGLLCAVLAGVGEGAWGQRAISLDEIFRVAEANSARLRTSLASEREADMAVDEARMARLPDIDASLSVSFLGDGLPPPATSLTCTVPPSLTLARVWASK